MDITYSDILTLTDLGSITIGYSNGYSYRKSLIIDYTKVSATLTDFPVLISETKWYLKTIANGGLVVNGNDIIICSDVDGLTKLSHEVESYNATTGEIVIWVKIPSLSHTANTTIYLFYGNTLISTSQEDIVNVWNSNFKGVWHVPSNSNLLDSTSNNNDGTGINTPSSVAGKINGGLGLASASSQYINAGAGATLVDVAVTYSAWVKATSFSDFTTIISKDANPTPYYDLTLSLRSTGKLAVFVSCATGQVASNGDGVTALSTGVWYLIGFSYSAADGLRTYINGIQDKSVAAKGNITGTFGTCYLGSNQVAGGRYFNGSIDEVHISNIVRPVAWLLTEYNNQSSPSTFFSTLEIDIIASDTMSMSDANSVNSPFAAYISQFVVEFSCLINPAAQELSHADTFTLSDFVYVPTWLNVLSDLNLWDDIVALNLYIFGQDIAIETDPGLDVMYLYDAIKVDFFSFTSPFAQFFNDLIEYRDSIRFQLTGHLQANNIVYEEDYFTLQDEINIGFPIDILGDSDLNNWNDIDIIIPGLTLLGGSDLNLFNDTAIFINGFALKGNDSFTLSDAQIISLLIYNLTAQASDTLSFSDSINLTRSLNKSATDFMYMWDRVLLLFAISKLSVDSFSLLDLVKITLSDNYELDDTLTFSDSGTISLNIELSNISVGDTLVMSDSVLAGNYDLSYIRRYLNDI